MAKTKIIIDEGKQFLMLRINTPTDISFIKEHQKLLRSNKSVWFCCFGKKKLKKSLINRDGNYIFVKESIVNGNNKYLLEISEISTVSPSDGYPIYYDQINAIKPLWFKIVKIHNLPPDFESNFELASTKRPVETIYKSMCTSFYIRCIKQFKL